ncbi:Serine/Threonine-kinase ATM [Trifolium repens]|nr:Serine/Threonine-kinase ATM [Trifolium repens]
MTIGAIRRLNSTVFDLEGFSVQMFQNKLLIIPEAATTTGKVELCMHSPAFSPFHIQGKNLRLETKNLQSGLVDICFSNCPRMSEAHFCISSNFKTHWIDYISKRKDNVPKLFSRLPEIETTICLNRKRKRLDKHDLCHAFLLTGRDIESEGNAYISKNTRPRISHVKMLEPEESIRKDNQACINFSEASINFTDEVQKLHLKRSQNLILQQSNNDEVDVSAAKVKFILGSNSSVYQKRLQRICYGDITPLKSKESIRIKSSSGDCLVESKDSYHYVASCSIFKSKVRQQSKTHVPFCSKSLHMKFPKNFNLPSKEQLIKKFSVFGSVDSSNTRVSWYCGSAQVAFFEESDAVAAYQYAKRKLWFGEANIRFWLDPFEHKQRELKHLYPMQPSENKLIGPPLKSCLKKSNSLKQENRKKDYRVRFTIET